MEWLSCIRKAIDYMEEHLEDNISAQDVNTKIWKEWLPGNPDFEFPGRVNIEWYGDGDPSASDYHAAIWIPVKKK